MTEHASESARKQQIIASALTLFITKGYEKTTVDQIAEASGLSKGAVYWYFDSKLRILTAIADNFVAEGVGLLQNLCLTREMNPQKLYLVHRELVDKQLNHREQNLFFDLLAGLADRYPEIRERLVWYDQQWDDTVASLIEIGINNGYFKQVDSIMLAKAINSLYLGLAHRQRLDSSIDLLDVIETATRLFYEAIIIKEQPLTA